MRGCRRSRLGASPIGAPQADSSTFRGINGRLPARAGPLQLFHGAEQSACGLHTPISATLERCSSSCTFTTSNKENDHEYQANPQRLHRDRSQGRP